MRNSIISNTALFILVGKINGLSLAVKKAKSKVVKSKVELKDIKHIIKKDIGKESRHHLLAYAFLKEIPYLTVEKKCREDNKPNAQAITNVIKSCICDYDKTYYPETWSVTTVKLWLSGNLDFSLKEIKERERLERIETFRRGMVK